MNIPTPPITIVGAGVLGLSVARTIQNRHPRQAVTIIAAELPASPSTWTSTTRPSADYASMWAGAHYRPIPRSSRQLDEEADLAIKTAKTMFTIARESPEAGVQRMPATEYLDMPLTEYASVKTGDVFAGPGDQFRVLAADELPEGVNWGCKYQAWCLNVHRYCSWLLGTFIQRGGKVVQERLDSIEDAFKHINDPNVPIVVNCSGRNFDQDPKVNIIRGQTVLVRNECRFTATRQLKDGSWSFVIPRPQGGGTVVGGTKEVGDLETQARPETRAKILAAAAEAFPDFVGDTSEFEVIMDNVGRRPWREGGLRIETEVLPGDRKVVHGYGAGGRGYELSWGMAEQVADLVDQITPFQSRL